MTDALRTISTRRTRQTERTQGRTDEKRNNAGGYVFGVSQTQRLRRFLILGVDGGTYYAKPRELALENAQVVIDMAHSDPTALVDEIVDISTNGRAPRQQPALFALAIAASLADEDGRRYALAALPKVARTSTHLFTFAGYVEQFRGWGRSLRRAIAAWYTAKNADKLEYQAVKYRSRDGWTHRDLLRLSHPKTSDNAQRKVLDWMAHGSTPDNGGDLIRALESIQTTPVKDIAKTLHGGAFRRLPWETLPTEALNDAGVWRALLDNNAVPLGALLRQLPRLTRLGLTEGLPARLTDETAVKRARIHPLTALVALKTYQGGHSLKGDATWTPDPRIVDALDELFYLSFGTVTPTGKRTLLALDVSGSMGFTTIAGLPITPREASAAMAMVTARTEKHWQAVGFTGEGGFYRQKTTLTELDISPRRRLDDAVRAISNLPFGNTDCALPMTWALENGKKFDSFVIYTDNETWAGGIKPAQALEEYRRKTGIDAKLVVVGMTATDFTIADPNDPGQLDVVGFDTAAPNVMSEFLRG